MPHELAPAAYYLTTKEVAELLRVKERKVYDLAAAGKIPHRRITGKLLFPEVELRNWIEADRSPVATRRPSVLTGSHDPLLDWAVRESGSGLATLFNGSGDGLAGFERGRAALAGVHIPEATGWNIETTAARGLKNTVLIGWAQRARGLVVAKDMQDSITQFNDLKGKRVVQRQPGAGGAIFFDWMMRRESLDASDLIAVDGIAHTEFDAAAVVAAGQADAAIGIETMARQFDLGFVPLAWEHFDLIIDRHAYFTKPVQKLLAFSRSTACHDKAASMGGYDLAQMGQVRWLSD